MKGAFTWLSASVLEIIYPRYCIQCERLVAGAGHCCAQCLLDIEPVRAPWCSRCGYPLPGLPDGERLLCARCHESPYPLAGARSSILLRGTGARLVWNLKYRRGVYLQEDLRLLMQATPQLDAFLEGAVLVPVPLHWWRQCRRGYNQAELIARNLVASAGAARGVEVARLLKRERNTGTQTLLSREQRALNVAGAFALREAVAMRVDTARRIVLVDDVATTGATLGACAAALRTGGYRNITAYTLAHG